MDAFTDQYAASRSDLRPKTLNERRGLIRQFAEWSRSERLVIPDVNRRTAGKYVAEKLEGRDPATARKHLTALTDYWDFLIRRGHVTPPAGDPNGNPWTNQISTRRRSNRTGRGTQGNAEERPFTAEEVQALLYGPARESFNAKLVPDLVDVLTISLLSGLRQADLLRDAANASGLSREDFNAMQAAKTAGELAYQSAELRALGFHEEADRYVQWALLKLAGLTGRSILQGTSPN